MENKCGWASIEQQLHQSTAVTVHPVCSSLFQVLVFLDHRVPDETEPGT